MLDQVIRKKQLVSIKQKAKNNTFLCVWVPYFSFSGCRSQTFDLSPRENQKKELPPQPHQTVTPDTTTSHHRPITINTIPDNDPSRIIVMYLFVAEEERNSSCFDFRPPCLLNCLQRAPLKKNNNNNNNNRNRNRNRNHNLLRLYIQIICY